MATWFVILFFCSGTPPCEGKYWPIAELSNYACARLALVLRNEYEADGALCTQEVPAGMKALPGRANAERWA